MNTTDSPKPSTLRMRKLAARRRGERPGADGRACYTRIDALRVARVFRSNGFQAPSGFVIACAKALNLITVTTNSESLIPMLTAARSFARKNKRRPLWASPIVWLNRYTAELIEAGDGFDLLNPKP